MRYKFVKNRILFCIYLFFLSIKVQASVIGNKIIQELQLGKFNPAKSVWAVNTINDSTQIKILQVPFNVKIDKSLQTPASDFLQTYKNLIVSAEKTVDIASLDSFKDNKTLKVIKEALEELDKKHKPIIVRLVFGNVPFDSTRSDAKSIRDEITSNLPKNSLLKIYVAMYRAGYTQASWNHAKILSIDGKDVITGGINFIDSEYASSINPVNDLSIYYPNMGLAEPASKFLDNEWEYICKYSEFYTWASSLSRLSNTQLAAWENGVKKNNVCIRKLSGNYTFNAHHQLYGSANTDLAISTGRLAAIANWEQDTSDISQITMLNNAKSYIKISQQALFWPLIGIIYQFPNQVLKALCGALDRGVKVNIITSGYKGQGGPIGQEQANYSSFIRPSEVRKYMVMVCGYTPVNLYNTDYLDVRTNYNKVNPDFNLEYVPNHSKVIIIDGEDGGKLAYIGSHNTYDASHAEYGVIVDSKEFVDRLEAEFWDYNWKYSK